VLAPARVLFPGRRSVTDPRAVEIQESAVLSRTLWLEMRAFADRARRELAGLGTRLHHAIDAGSSSEQPAIDHAEPIPSGERRRHAALPTDDDREDRELVGESPSIEEYRTPFSRALGDAWKEVEPGIYVHAAPRLSGPARTPSR
jgi:hypothetical protein